MDNTTKLLIIAFLQQIIGLSKNTVTRWIVRELFTAGELPMAKWYTWEFLASLNKARVIGLLIIASFTLVTFPLGIWQSSFKIGWGYSMNRLVNSCFNLFLFPVNIYLMAVTLDEFQINNMTKLGIIGQTLGTVIMIISAYLMYQGNQT